MPDYRLTITIKKDVGDGDVRSLAEEILSEHGDNFDAHRGDFAISASKAGDSGHWFHFDLWED